MSHLDVVPVDQTTLNDWEAPPFSGIVKDGIIFGRGTLDDKVSVLGILEAVENLINNGFNPKRTIYLAFGHDEEIGGNNGAGVISNYLEKKGVELEFVLDEGGFISEGLIPGVDKPVAMINVAEKGYVSYELTIKTKGGHSSQPPRNNTIGSLATAITKLESNQFKLKMTPLIKTQINILGAEMSFLGKMFFANSWLFKNFLLEGFNAKTSIAPTIISGGIKDNVIPTTASVIINFRIMTGDDSNKIKQHIIKTIDDERISVKEINPANLPSPVSDYNSDSFKLIQKTISQIFPKVIVTPGLIGGGTDTKHYEKISKNAYRFYPMRANSENISGVHGINERISISNYKEIVQFVYQFLINQNNNDNE
jgi:carboxypeptidase PM20D1